MILKTIVIVVLFLQSLATDEVLLRNYAIAGKDSLNKRIACQINN